MKLHKKIIVSGAIITLIGFASIALATDMTTSTTTSKPVDFSSGVKDINAVDTALSKAMFTSKEMVKIRDGFTKETSQFNTKVSDLTKSLDSLSNPKDAITARTELEQERAKVEAAKKALLEAKNKEQVEKARNALKQSNKKIDTMATKVKKLPKKKTVKSLPAPTVKQPKATPTSTQ